MYLQVRVGQCWSRKLSASALRHTQQAHGINMFGSQCNFKIIIFNPHFPTRLCFPWNNNMIIIKCKRKWKRNHKKIKNKKSRFCQLNNSFPLDYTSSTWLQSTVYKGLLTFLSFNFFFLTPYLAFIIL